MKLLRLVLLVLAVACAFPACASALELEVNTTEDPGDGGCNYPGEACPLRQAIIIADASEDEESRITFGEGAEGVIKPEYPLPELRRGIEVDATAAPGWEGSPVVELDGTETTSESGTEGLRVAEGARAKIRGLAIGGFGLGIHFEHGSSGEACGNYIGTERSGTEARPNFDGIWIDEEARNVQIGRLCGEIGGNLISGNEEWGIVAAGKEIEIDRNLVGTDASGEAPLPNGPTGEGEGGGIRVGPHAIEVTVGGIDDMALPHNVVAFNDGPGVLVDSGALFATVRENSIFANEGAGIEDLGATASAEITSVAPIVKGTTTVKGSVQGLPNTTYDLEFFGNEECDPSGFGEGRFFVGSSGDEVKTDATGSAGFTATLLALVRPEAHFFTMTATDRPKTSTSEFSNCVSAPAPEEEKKEQTGPPAPPSPPPLMPIPVNGKSVTVSTKSGRVLVKVPGSNRFVPLGALESIPVGSIVDATNGRLTLTSADANGVTQTADFYEGRFQVQQQAGGALVTLRLRGGDFSSCASAGQSARPSKRSGRRLWGSGSGRFRTQGNFGSASVMGTIWLTADQCGGTFFKVKRGVVKVADFVLDRTISLPAGKSYLAKKPQN